MTKFNLSPTESKVLRALMENSRQSVLEISAATGLNRNTVRTVIKTLKESGIIKSFTIDLQTPRDQKLLMIETDDIAQIPENSRVETILLSNGRYLVITDLNALNVPLKYFQINVVSNRILSADLSRIASVYCDYCGKEILDHSLSLKYKNHTYYACCKNCKSDLLKRLSTIG